jgi:hypothetical protein
MTIKDFSAEEQELIKTGVNKTLQEFRRQLVLDMQVTVDEDLKDFVKIVFDKFRLVTEREWEDMQKLIPLVGMKIDETEQI